MEEAAARRIVVGVDGSDCGGRAVEWAVGQARLTSARLQFVTAWHVPFLAYGAIGLLPPLSTEVDVSFRAVAEDLAAAAAARAQAAGVEAQSTVRHGQPADVLIEEAEGADLLVVGSRGHGGFAGLLLGSVSAQCAHHAPCSLVIVR